MHYFCRRGRQDLEKIEKDSLTISDAGNGRKIAHLKDEEPLASLSEKKLNWYVTRGAESVKNFPRYVRDLFVNAA